LLLFAYNKQQQIKNMTKEKTNVVSIKRIEANKRNAKLSTGPKSSA